MNVFSHTWIAAAIHGNRGIYWCSAWFGGLALLAFASAVYDSGALELTLGVAVGGLHAYAALGLLRGLKPAWHIAAFLAFVTIVFKLLAVSCAPGKIADGERHLAAAAFDVLMLALAIVVFMRLRRPDVRRLYGVPVSYAPSPSD